MTQPSAAHLKPAAQPTTSANQYIVLDDLVHRALQKEWLELDYGAQWWSNDHAPTIYANSKLVPPLHTFLSNRWSELKPILQKRPVAVKQIRLKPKTTVDTNTASAPSTQEAPLPTPVQDFSSQANNNEPLSDVNTALENIAQSESNPPNESPMDSFSEVHSPVDEKPSINSLVEGMNQNDVQPIQTEVTQLPTKNEVNQLPLLRHCEISTSFDATVISNIAETTAGKLSRVTTCIPTLSNPSISTLSNPSIPTLSNPSIPTLSNPTFTAFHNFIGHPSITCTKVVDNNRNNQELINKNPLLASVLSVPVNNAGKVKKNRTTKSGPKSKKATNASTNKDKEATKPQQRQLKTPKGNAIRRKRTLKRKVKYNGHKLLKCSVKIEVMKEEILKKYTGLGFEDVKNKMYNHNPMHGFLGFRTSQSAQACQNLKQLINPNALPAEPVLDCDGIISNNFPSTFSAGNSEISESLPSVNTTGISGHHINTYNAISILPIRSGTSYCRPPGTSIPISTNINGLSRSAAERLELLNSNLSVFISSSESPTVRNEIFKGNLPGKASFPVGENENEIKRKMMEETTIVTPTLKSDNDSVSKMLEKTTTATPILKSDSDSVSKMSEETSTAIDSVSKMSEATTTATPTLESDNDSVSKMSEATTTATPTLESDNDSVSKMSEETTAATPTLESDNDSVSKMSEATTAATPTLKSDNDSVSKMSEETTKATPILKSDNDSVSKMSEATTAATPTLESYNDSVSKMSEATTAATPTLESDNDSVSKMSEATTAATPTLESDNDSVSKMSEATTAATPTLKSDNDSVSKMSEATTTATPTLKSDNGSVSKMSEATTTATPTLKSDNGSVSKMSEATTAATPTLESDNDSVSKMSEATTAATPTMKSDNDSVSKMSEETSTATPTLKSDNDSVSKMSEATTTATPTLESDNDSVSKMSEATTTATPTLKSDNGSVLSSSEKITSDLPLVVSGYKNVLTSKIKKKKIAKDYVNNPSVSKERDHCSKKRGKTSRNSNNKGRSLSEPSEGRVRGNNGRRVKNKERSISVSSSGRIDGSKDEVMPGRVRSLLGILIKKNHQPGMTSRQDKSNSDYKNGKIIPLGQRSPTPSAMNLKRRLSQQEVDAEFSLPLINSCLSLASEKKKKFHRYVNKKDIEEKPCSPLINSNKDNDNASCRTLPSNELEPAGQTIDLNMNYTNKSLQKPLSNSYPPSNKNKHKDGNTKDSLDSNKENVKESCEIAKKNCRVEDELPIKKIRLDNSRNEETVTKSNLIIDLSRMILEEDTPAVKPITKKHQNDNSTSNSQAEERPVMELPSASFDTYNCLNCEIKFVHIKDWKKHYDGEIPKCAKFNAQNI